MGVCKVRSQSHRSANGSTTTNSVRRSLKTRDRTVRLRRREGYCRVLGEIVEEGEGWMRGKVLCECVCATVFSKRAKGTSIDEGH